MNRFQRTIEWLPLCILAVATFLLLPTFAAFAQPELAWERAYRGNGSSNCWKHIVTADGGFALACEIGDNQQNQYDFYVIKTNAQGEAEWECRHNVDGTTISPRGIVQTDDGGYVVSGTIGEGAATNLYAISLSANGEVGWAHSYGGNQDEEGGYIARAVDGGYVISGSTSSFGNPSDGYLVHIDDQGELIWEHNYNFGGQFDMFTGIIAVADGYVVTGTGSANRRVLLAKMDRDGALQWTHYYEADDGALQLAWDLCAAGDDGFAICGHVNVVIAGGHTSEGLLIRTENNGNPRWVRRYMGQSGTIAYSIAALPGGGFLLGGRTSINSDFFWALWTDDAGEGIGERTYNGYCWSVEVKADGLSSMAGNDGSNANLLSFAPIQYSFTIHLSANWNIYSAPTIPANPDIRTLFAPLVQRGTLVMVKDDNGNFYAPAIGFCNIPAWNYHQGYLIQVTRNDSLVIEGEPVAVDAAIPLRFGWNTAAYFPDAEQGAQDAFQPLGDRLVVAKDGSGNFYVPALGFSNMGNLSRGFGYQIKVANEGDFIWHQPQRRR